MAGLLVSLLVGLRLDLASTSHGDDWEWKIARACLILSTRALSSASSLEFHVRNKLPNAAHSQ